MSKKMCFLSIFFDPPAQIIDLTPLAAGASLEKKNGSRNRRNAKLLQAGGLEAEAGVGLVAIILPR